MPEPSESVRQVFGNRIELAQRYVERLAGAGMERGLVGPREVGRLWERHLVNSALVADVLPSGAEVADVGSGAGLPGIPLAIRRPDLRIVLIEPMQRRVEFLGETIEELGLAAQVSVCRGRAESVAVHRAVGRFAWVTARAVARLDRLVPWCLPLLSEGGTLLAMKGASAADEVAESRSALRRERAAVVGTQMLLPPVGGEPTWVVVVQRISVRPGREHVST